MGSYSVIHEIGPIKLRKKNENIKKSKAGQTCIGAIFRHSSICLCVCICKLCMCVYMYVCKCVSSNSYPSADNQI